MWPYLRFIARHRRFLAFGVLLALASSFGQTFFIALFGAELRAAMDLSHGEFGALYSAATLASGLLLLWLGSAVDRFDLRAVTACVCLGLVASAAAMAVAESLWLLLLAIFGLRLSGQGLLGHVSATSMARYFDDGRGRALSIASLGHPAGEAVFPALAVIAIAALGWRQSWAAVAALVALVVIPTSMWLLRGHALRHDRMLARAEREVRDEGRRHWRRSEVLRDLRLYLILPAVLAPAFINTGVFFHQVHIVASKGWSLSAFAAAFTVYATSTVAGALWAGALVDRLGGVRMLKFVLLPLGAGLAIMALSAHLAAAFAYMALAGATQGAATTAFGAMWAERYGYRHLGSIRALAQSLMVLTTALAPYTLGILIDAGVSVERVFAVLVAYVGVAVALVMVASRADR